LGREYVAIVEFATEAKPLFRPKVRLGLRVCSTKAGRLTVGAKEDVTIAVNAAQFTLLW
jgi:hypothetical protein